MANDFYAKGTIKVKNADGVLVPFLPKTDISCVDSQNNVALTQTISNLQTQITEAENSGGIELMTTEPTDENTSSFANETLIGYILPATWKYTVDTSYIPSYNQEMYRRVTGIPMHLYYQGGGRSILNVNWGDGTQSTLSRDDFPYDDDSAGIHQYEEDGTYQVQITATIPHWEQLYLDCTLMGFSSLAYISSNSKVDPKLRFFKATITSVDNPLPTINGMYGNTLISSNNNTVYYTAERVPNSLCGLFYQCINLTKIPEDIFVNNPHITNFKSCFAGCSSLTNFAVHIQAPNVTIADYFVTPKDGVERVVYVPQGSTTQETFNALADTLKITVIGE